MKLYIDPGTGSMLFSLTIGLLSVFWFGLKKLYIKIKYRTGGSKSAIQKRNIIIYSEDKRYWATFKGILDECEKRKIKVGYVAGSKDDPLLAEKYEYVETEVIGLGNKAYARLNFLNARIVLATTPGLDVYQWKRSKDVDWYIHLTHSIGPGIGYRMFGTQFYDAVLISSDTYIWQHREIEKKRGSDPKDILSIGSPYMDYLLERKKRLSLVDTGNNITVLLAPTWGQSGILSRFGEKILDSLVETGFNIILRPHPQSYISESEMIIKLQNKYPETENFHWNKDSDNFAVLSKANVLISDFSGVVYDFAFVFERPVLYTDVNIDYSVYDSAWLDNPTAGLKTLAKIGQKLEEEKLDQLKPIIEDLVRNTSYHDSILEARDECWQHRGHASEKIVDYILTKLEEINEINAVQGNSDKILI